MEKLGHYRKFIASLVGFLYGAYVLYERADLSTKEGVQAFVGAVLLSLVVYVAPNEKPTSPSDPSA